jgi:SAM-dependent methyltransferase
MSEIDYVLGTHDEEIERLGLQHRVWRPLMLDAWIRAGITGGSRFADFGAGPGFATLDAAAIVGLSGEVAAIERSQQFLNFAKNQVNRQKFFWVRFIQADLDMGDFVLEGFDLAWCRWVASFVASPAALIERISASLRVGGKAVLHEYQNYSTWQTIPQGERLGQFVQEVMASWRATGGEPDVVNELLPRMDSAGLRVISLRPLISAIGPSHFTWGWPASFIASGSRRLVELGRISPQDADAIQAEFHRLEQNPSAVMITPLVMEIIAEKIA